MSETRKPRPTGDGDLIARVRAAARQEQFLEVVSAEEARSRFEKHLTAQAICSREREARRSRGRVLANDVIAAVDAPPFDRSNVDGFAVRAVDTSGASDGSPKVLTLNPEVIACGHAPAFDSAAGDVHSDRDRRRHPARRQRRGHDRADRADRGRRAAPRGAPCRAAGTIHFLRRLGHRARRNIAAARRAKSARARSACWRPAGLTALKWSGGRKWPCFRPATNLSSRASR